MNLKTLTIFLLFLLTGVSTMYAQQQVELIFSHKLHAESVGAACSDCHAGADSSLKPTDNLLPEMETCYACHDQDAECSLCHKDPDNAVVYPRITDYIAFFPHAAHIEKEVPCSQCHQDIEQSNNIFDKHLPPMATCVTCHNDMDQVDYCLSCHSKDENLKPKDHNLTWQTAHGIISQTSEDECKVCHTENQCLTCHTGDNLDHKVHPLNFVNNHAIQAKGNKENCYTCHEELAFCVTCHQEQMVMPRTHASAGWSNKTTGGGHKRAAHQDLDQCMSCHNESFGDLVCVQCHQAN